MAGRPKMMAKRADALYRSAETLVDDMLEVIPDQYLEQGVISPEWPEEMRLDTASLSERIELAWRVCFGHAGRLRSLLAELTILLCEKAGCPPTFDPRTSRLELKRLERIDNPTDATEPRASPESKRSGETSEALDGSGGDRA